MYRITLNDGEVLEVAELQYITFNPLNQSSYFCDEEDATGISTGEEIYLVESLINTDYKKNLAASVKNVEFCTIEEIPMSTSILQMQQNISSMQKRTELIDEQNLTIMNAITDLYEKLEKR